MSRLLHEVIRSDADMVEKLTNSKLFSLVRELNHKYGLMVYGENKIGQRVRDGDDDFLLTDGQGLPIARIFMDGDAYCYHAPYISKERGTDEFDRSTFRSKKLSTLMTTLKRCKVVSSSDEVLNNIDGQVDNMVRLVINGFPYKSKNSLDGDDVHKLLLAIAEHKDMNSFQQSDRDKYLELLDKYNESDILKVSRRQGVEDMFRDTYLVFGDCLGHYIIAGAGYEYESNNQNLTIKVKTPFKRVKDLTAYPSILTTLTMHKVHKGEEFKPYAKDILVPIGDKYIPDLEIVYGYRSRNSAFDMGIVCLAK